MANVTLMTKRVLAQIKGIFDLDFAEKLGFRIPPASYSYASMIANGSF